MEQGQSDSSECSLFDITCSLPNIPIPRGDNILKDEIPSPPSTTKTLTPRRSDCCGDEDKHKHVTTNDSCCGDSGCSEGVAMSKMKSSGSCGDEDKHKHVTSNDSCCGDSGCNEGLAMSKVKSSGNCYYITFPC